MVNQKNYEIITTMPKTQNRNTKQEGESEEDQGEGWRIRAATNIHINNIINSRSNLICSNQYIPLRSHYQYYK